MSQSITTYDIRIYQSSWTDSNNINTTIEMFYITSKRWTTLELVLFEDLMKINIWMDLAPIQKGTYTVWKFAISKLWKQKSYLELHKLLGIGSWFLSLFSHASKISFICKAFFFFYRNVLRKSTFTICVWPPNLKHTILQKKFALAQDPKKCFWGKEQWKATILTSGKQLLSLLQNTFFLLWAWSNTSTL